MTAHLALSPHGRLYFEQAKCEGEQAEGPLSRPLAAIRAAFESSSADGLLALAGDRSASELPADFAYWRDLTTRVLQSICHLDERQRAEFSSGGTKAPGDQLLPPPDALALAVMVADAPPMRGLEYLSPETLRGLWSGLITAVKTRAAKTAGGLLGLLKEIHPRWELLGRVTFHLAENKKDPDKPFAFLATFTHRLSANSIKHLPLAEALRQYAGAKDQAKLAELLTPVRLASERSPLIRGWLDSRALFQPQALAIPEAYQFLRDVPQMEECGLVIRVPDWWRSRQSSRPTVQVRLGNRRPGEVGADALLDFSIDLALDGKPLSAEEQRELLASENGLTLLRGRWVEVDLRRLNDALQHWRLLQRDNADGIEFLRGMRMLAGVSLDREPEEIDPSWVHVVPGQWLREVLQTLRDPSGKMDCAPGDGLQANLRHYQIDGVRWLWFMTTLRLGACLADDMGLGKTIQVIDLLLRRRVQTSVDQKNPTKEIAPRTHLLVVPATLIGNWKAEFSRFAPQLSVLYAHRSECDAARLEQLAKNPRGALQDVDAVVISYTLARTAKWLEEVDWDLHVLDEAQAIKNASSAQTRSIKKLRSVCRVVLTGTPVENHLGDLWSLFDFCSPGLLGTASQFKDFLKRLDKQTGTQGYGALRRLVQPYVLRRMKTDPAIVPDLPDKTEMRVDCGLSRRQAALYQEAVKDLAEQLRSLKQSGKEGSIDRRGAVLASMMRLKQICNHPSQYLARDSFPADESGKFLQLAEICEPINQRQEKALVFTQFQSMCQPLCDFLQALFGRPGVVLHGGTPVARRKDLVRRFQEDEAVPYFVISLKAGGTGLNLTAATHVVHFDRWWNPAVENQATDRAFRIGQRRNVLVHKFVCRGTLEERIDEMLARKQTLADQILGTKQEGERLLTELSDQDLLAFVSLNVESCTL